MPCWYYDKKELKHTPSMNQGMAVDQEIAYRREGARFILQVGNKMGLRYETMATGVVYFHRFYMVHTFQEFPRHVTACCCLFLAGKVEETPKKCKDIMNVARSCLTDDSIWSEFGKEPKEEVMTLERILLQTIKFDFIVDHPYSYLLKYAKALKGDKKKLHQIVQMAWTFVNDSLCTTLCLQWEPEIIAIALMYLAGKLNKVEVNDWQGKNSKCSKWWDMFVHGISLDLLEDICHQVLDLYSPNKMESSGGALTNPSESTPKSVEKKVITDAATPPKKPKKEEKHVLTPPKVDPITHTPPPSYSFTPHYSTNFPPYPPPAPPLPPPRYPFQYQPPPPTTRYPPPTTTPSTVAPYTIPYQSAATPHYPPPSPTTPTNVRPPAVTHYPPPPHGNPPFYSQSTTPARPSYQHPPPAVPYDNYIHTPNRPYYPAS